MSNSTNYRLSFTAASLRINEMSELARLYLEPKPSIIQKDTIIKGRKSRTTDREFRELRFRIETLTKEQLRVLAHGDLIAKKQVAFLAACKLYAFIREFVIEVLREKALLFDLHLTDGEYFTFFRRKSEQHHELEEIADSTEKKIKQLTFKILEQGGLIDNVESKNILPQIVENSVMHAISSDNPEWLKIFLLSDYDITNSLK